MSKTDRHRRILYHSKTSRKAMTLAEIIVAMTIIVIVFVAVIPQIRAIRMSWSSERENTELIENGQALMDHVSAHLMKADRILLVSAPNNTDGFIEFIDNNDITMRYQITNGYVQYGPIGNLADLAGPVSSLQFACYDAYDLNTPTLEVDFVRSIEVHATLPNPNALGRDQSFAAWTYLRANYLSEQIIVGVEYTFDNSKCRTPALAKIDNEHYLCAYEGPASKGDALVLIPRYISDEWQIAVGTRHVFDNSQCYTPELCQIDATHYLCAYRGPGCDGWAVVLEVTTGTWTVTHYTNFEFANNTGLPSVGSPDADPAFRPALVKINDTHYLCAYMGAGFDGWAVVLIINPSTYTITAGTPFEFDVLEGQGPSLAQIDNTHYLCAYAGPSADGTAVVLEVDTGDWTITKKTPFIFDPVKGQRPDLAKIDNEHYLCAYGGPDDDGFAVVLNVNQATWEITKNTAYEFDTERGEMTKLQKIDAANYVCSYEGDAGREEDYDLPATILLYIDLFDYAVYRKTPVMMYGDEEGDAPDIAVIDDRTFITAYDGFPWQGNSAVLEVDLAIRP